MRVLGIEGTAWAASAAVFDTTTDEVWIETDAYVPESGGIDPREAADHMSEAIPTVVEAAMTHARERTTDLPPIDAVAFSRGPGLGPCLRTVGTAARALAGTLSVPLIGVNHMIAHLEIGRYRSGFDAPVCLNASGANAHVLGYHEGRYRVLGETMDTGVGNALDKFARHLGWSHPGGPKVESAAADGTYTSLPYVVKGMDFSFSGITTAAQDAVDAGTPVEDVCTGLQETIFAMLTEVSERALSVTGADELVLGGGVGQNDRLKAMLEEMCAQRGASFYAPESRFLRDNAGMIAVLGAQMYEAGDTIAIEDSAVDPTYRPDEVPVTWRHEESVRHVGDAIETGSVEGAEATVTRVNGCVRKRRHPKSYRHPDLDRRLRRERTAMEARLTALARRAGVPTPVLTAVDPEAATLTFEYVGEADLRTALTDDRIHTVGGHLARLHAAGIVHGDPTTRNVRVNDNRVYLLDFGLGYHSEHPEDFAMDLHVFAQSAAGTAPDPDAARVAVLDGYRATGASLDLDATTVVDRLAEIEGRGRYQ